MMLMFLAQKYQHHEGGFGVYGVTMSEDETPKVVHCGRYSVSGVTL